MHGVTRRWKQLRALIALAILWLVSAADLSQPSWAQSTEVGPSLVSGLDLQAAEDSTSPEEALWVLGEALKAVDGPKDILFLGWGLGRLTGGLVRMPRVYEDALASLMEAEMTVHVLNVFLGSNLLSVGLSHVAEATGGSYGRMLNITRGKIDRLGRLLTGYYVLVLDADDLRGLAGRLRIRLREEPKGVDVRIHHRQIDFYLP